ncbi:MAG: hypothetical protein CSA49_01065 [Gammaproteobacteria bacterium]|nr:MAG: hypothetical protein CSA49_01065 [Gammaproteobacteria bacterium]
MKQFILTLSRTFLACLITFIVIAAVVVGLGRQLLTHINEAKPEIESYLSSVSDLNIQFQAIHGQWHRLTPQINLSELYIGAKGNDAAFLQVKEISAEIDLSASLLNLHPIIKLWVDGLALDLVFNEGRFELINGPDQADTQHQATQPEDQSIHHQIDFFLRQPHIQLSNSNINIQGFWTHDVTVSDINVGLARNGLNKRFWFDLILNGDSRISVNMKGEMQGRFTDLDSLSGNLYAKVTAPDLAPWMPVPLKALTALEIYESKGSVEVWGKVSEGHVERVTSRFELSDVSVGKEGSELPSPKLNKVSGLAKWQGDWYRNWQIGLQSFEISGEDFHWAPDKLVLHSKLMADNKRRYMGSVDNASIAPWVKYAVSLLNPESGIYQTLKTVQPEALLNNVKFSLDMQNDSVADFQVLADIKHISMQPQRWIPGLNNVSAKALLAKEVSVIELEGHAVDLNYPDLFRNQISVNEVSGALLVRNTDEQWAIESGLLQINDEHLNGVTQLAVIKKKLSEELPYLRLQANLRNVDVEQSLYDLLPVGVIPNGVVGWLDSAVKKGSLLRGDLLFHGPVDLQAFEPFQYILGFTAEDLTLQYLPEWKAVEGITADICIYNGNVDAWATKADYYGGKLDSAWVATGKNPDGDIELTVDARLQAPIEDAIQILVDSPIKNKTAPVLDKIAVKGDGDIRVEVGFPFREDATGLAVAVDVQVDGGEFTLIEQGLVVENLAGRVLYDLEQGLSSPGLQGKLFGGSINAVIKTKADEEIPSGQETIVIAKGHGRLDQIKPWLKFDFLDPVAGTIDYQANIYLKPEPENAIIQRSHIEIFSDLLGVSSAYPEPLSKAGFTVQPFYYKSTLGGEQRHHSISLDSVFDLQMVTDKQGIYSGAIAFGQKANLPDEPYFSVSGEIEALNLAQWQQAYQAISQTGESSVQPTPADTRPIDFGDSRLLIKKLNIQGQKFHNVDFALSQQSDNLLVMMRSPEASAAVVLPRAYLAGSEYRLIKEPVQVDVKRLALNVDKPVISETGTHQGLDPEILPAMNINIQELLLSGEDFGSWQLGWTPQDRGVQIDTASFNFKGITFSGDGQWLWEGDVVKTSLKGKAVTQNVADVIAQWGYAKSITSESAHAKLEAIWQGAPYDFDLSAANASWTLVIKDGRFKHVSSSAADKALGFLNFDDWLSRMHLKIRDLESNELPYNVIRGDFVLENQVLSSKKLTIDSAALNMVVDGTLSLASHQVNADLAVAIPVARNLVLPAALVGGIPMAATVYAIEKVIGSQLDKLTTIKYTVTGPLSDPVFAPKGSLDAVPAQIRESSGENDDKGLNTFIPEKYPLPFEETYEPAN